MAAGKHHAAAAVALLLLLLLPSPFHTAAADADAEPSTAGAAAPPPPHSPGHQIHGTEDDICRCLCGCPAKCQSSKIGLKLCIGACAFKCVTSKGKTSTEADGVMAGLDGEL